jgi:hypothetical protein
MIMTRKQTAQVKEVEKKLNLFINMIDDSNIISKDKEDLGIHLTAIFEILNKNIEVIK